MGERGREGGMERDGERGREGDREGERGREREGGEYCAQLGRCVFQNLPHV